MQSATVVLALLHGTTAFPNDCANVTVLHSVTRDGWDAGCAGVQWNEDQTTAEGCKKSCYDNVNCTVWQWVQTANEDGEKLKCWTGGDVHGCGERVPIGQGNQEQFQGNLKDGERIQHGAVRVIQNNSFIWTKGLKHYPEEQGDESYKIARCKL